MTAAFRYCEEHGINPDVMVFLSDLYTPFGGAPGYPVFWASTTDQVAPYGRTVKIEV